MFCKHCGNEVDDHATFCGKCGKRLIKDTTIDNPSMEDIPVGKHKQRNKKILKKTNAVLALLILVTIALGISAIFVIKKNSPKPNEEAVEKTILYQHPTYVLYVQDKQLMAYDEEKETSFLISDDDYFKTASISQFQAMPVDIKTNVPVVTYSKQQEQGYGQLCMAEMDTRKPKEVVIADHVTWHVLVNENYILYQQDEDHKHENGTDLYLYDIKKQSSKKLLESAIKVKTFDKNHMLYCLDQSGHLYSYVIGEKMEQLSSSVKDFDTTSKDVVYYVKADGLYEKERSQEENRLSRWYGNSERLFGIKVYGDQDIYCYRINRVYQRLKDYIEDNTMGNNPALLSLRIQINTTFMYNDLYAMYHFDGSSLQLIDDTIASYWFSDHDAAMMYVDDQEYTKEKILLTTIQDELLNNRTNLVNTFLANIEDWREDLLHTRYIERMMYTDHQTISLGRHIMNDVEFDGHTVYFTQEDPSDVLQPILYQIHIRDGEASESEIYSNYTMDEKGRTLRYLNDQMIYFKDRRNEFSADLYLNTTFVDGNVYANVNTVKVHDGAYYYLKDYQEDVKASTLMCYDGEQTKPIAKQICNYVFHKDRMYYQVKNGNHIHLYVYQDGIVEQIGENVSYVW